ncbi:glycosyltransferase family 2 protein [Chryseobacterium wangxinyae]|uniref:glycosyltransferase n=1 Tax=Chryseobacterium sp. CY350 TaxID=2997336 RepID=UPI002271A2D9|nr:glycosyltransferase family 2 protein [Chryseobacterium sp. CY350]MCY0978737.1 glycosyltransferase family 2 protein [Chryseobacterium sp. CY350]WBZ93882.1 glycosyltransferase family 2 protein [Chryseobacterium sp. CY350]
MNDLAIIILNYNSSEKIIHQVNELIDEGIDSSAFYIVDNASNEDDKKKLKNYTISKQLNFIQSKENGGYAKGNRLAIEKALNDDKDYFLILNPDIEISHSVVRNLYNTIKKDQNLYFVGPRICDKFDREYIFSDGGKVNRDDFFEASHINGGRKISEVDIPEFNANIDYVNGSAIMFKKETLDLIGMMRDDFFMYFEETEWCYRLKSISHAKQAIITTEIAYHEMSKQDTFQNFYMTRNRIFLCRLYKLPHQKLISKFLYEAQKKLFRSKGNFTTNLSNFTSQVKAVLEGEFKKLV